MKNDGRFTQNSDELTKLMWRLLMVPLNHSSHSKIKDVFVYLCISLIRYETATWMEWDHFTSSLWRVVSIDFFFLYFMCLSKILFIGSGNPTDLWNLYIQINVLLALPLVFPKGISIKWQICFRTDFLNTHSFCHWTNW